MSASADLYQLAELDRLALTVDDDPEFVDGVYGRHSVTCLTRGLEVGAADDEFDAPHFVCTCAGDDSPLAALTRLTNPTGAVYGPPAPAFGSAA